MAIDTQLITRLREQTGAGIADIKAALDEADGDTDKAVELLRKKGAMKAAKKTVERTAGDGLVASYIHANGRVGVLLELRCETDFVARTQDFKSLAHEITLQVAAANPIYLNRESVSETILEKEREIYREQLRAKGKPEKMWDKIIEGKLEKFYQENCLVEQRYIKDDSKTIAQLVDEHIAKLGEKIEIGKFIRFQV